MSENLYRTSREVRICSLFVVVSYQSLSSTSARITSRARGWVWGSLWRHQMEKFSALLTLCVGNSPVIGEFPAQSQRYGTLMLSLICARINGWVNNREAGDLRHHRAHYDVIVMVLTYGYLPGCSGLVMIKNLFQELDHEFQLRHCFPVSFWFNAGINNQHFRVTVWNFLIVSCCIRPTKRRSSCFDELMT